MRVPFFRVAERKSPKKGRPYCARPFAALRATCDARTGGAPQNSLRATRSVQTTAASQCTKRVCPSAHARTPCPALLGTRRREPRVRTSTRAIASLRCARPHLAGASASRCAAWAERSNGPNGCPAVRLFGCSAVHPLLAAPAAGRLRGGTRVGARVLRALTRRGCLNEAAPQRSEFHGAPRNRHDAGLPLRNAKGSQTGGRLSFGYFSLAKQRTSPSPAGASPGLRLQPQHAFHTSAPRPRQAQPERYGANRVAIKTIATSAFYTSASRQNHQKFRPQAARISFSSFTASTANARIPSASFSVAIASSFSANRNPASS